MKSQLYPVRTGIAQWCCSGIRAGCLGVRVPVVAGNFSLHHRVQTCSGSYPASYQMGTRDFSMWIKRPGREADHSPLSSAEVKNAWSYTSTPPSAFMSWCWVKAQGQLYLYLLSSKSHTECVREYKRMFPHYIYFKAKSWWLGTKSVASD
jgi:hypothetical protein